MPNGLSSEQMIERMYTEMVGINGQGGMKADIKENRDAGIEGRRKIHEKIDKVCEEVVKKSECLAAQGDLHKEIKSAVQEALNGKKRSRGLMVRDFIVTLFGAGGVGTVLILWLLGKLK